MSITNQTNIAQASGNGVTTAFSFSFKIFDATQLQVSLVNSTTGVAVLKTLNVDYTVSISTVTEGGTVTWMVAPPTGYKSFIKRIVPYTQSAVLPTEGVLPAKQIENQLDLMTMMVVQISEIVGRCFQVPATSGITLVLPTPVDGYALGWQGTGGTMQNLPVDSSAIAAAVTSTTNSANAAAASAAAAAASAASISMSGMISMWPTNSAPSGWLICDGSAVNRTTYAALFTAIGTTYGVGDGSTTFNVPDFRGLMPVGRKSTDANFDILKTPTTYVGEKTHQLVTGEMPAHTHNVIGGNSGNVVGGPVLFDATNSAGTPQVTTSTGGDGAHNNMPPYMVINFIIKT